MHVQTFYCIVAVDWFGLLIFNYEMLQGVYVLFYFYFQAVLPTLRLKSLAVGKRPQQEGGEILLTVIGGSHK